MTKEPTLLGGATSDPEKKPDPAPELSVEETADLKAELFNLFTKTRANAPLPLGFEEQFEAVETRHPQNEGVKRMRQMISETNRLYGKPTQPT